MAKNFKDYWLNDYTADTWTTVYTFNSADPNANKSILLSMLVKNFKAAGIGSSVNIEVQIVNNLENIIIYPLTKCTLSAQDEFHIDRAKQFILLEPGWKIRVKYSANDIYTYLSVLENV